MIRLCQNARRWCLIGLMIFPLLGQTQGCLGMSRSDVAAAAAGVVSAATNSLISDAVNRLLDVPVSSFSRFL